MQQTLLVIHILAAATWFGSSVSMAFFGPQMRAAGDVPAAAFQRAANLHGRTIFMAAGLLVLLTGIGLVLNSDDLYSFSDTFVSIGFLVVIVGAILGMAVFGPASRAAAEAHEAGDHEAAAKSYQKYLIFGTVDLVLLVLAVAVMVDKTGAG